MKTNLFLSLILAALLSFNGVAQEKELWGLAPTSGYIYKLDQNGENKEIVYNISGANGYGPGSGGSLLQASNKKLYGMTSNAGENNMGTLFEYDIAQQQFTTLIVFDGTIGKNPESNNLIQASNGKLYGMTPEGGSHNAGIIFEYDLSSSTFNKLFDFHDTLGKGPNGDLYQTDNADSIIFYGITTEGGKNNGGTLFKYNLTDSSYKVVISFDGYYQHEHGTHPYGSVMQADNGKLYGLTYQGGTTADNGVMFEYNPETGEFFKKVDFINNETGKRPKGSLIQASDGKLYGTTVYGGVSNAGTVFSYDIANDTLIQRASLGDGAGTYPLGSLLQASNGKMYGTTYLGACSSGGVFEFDPVNDSIRRTACNGYPNGNLIEIEAICLETSDSIIETACGSYISPSGNYTWTASGIYTDTIPNVCGGDSIIKINLTVNTVDVSVTQDGINLSADLAGASYQWLDCDNGNAPLSGDTNQVFTATTNGNYAVAVTQDNCADTSACYSITTVGIDGNAFDPEIKLYPNPASEDVTIESVDLTDVIISVFNITGKKVYSVENKNKEKVIIPASEFLPGVYFVKIQNNKQERIIKLIKQ